MNNSDIDRLFYLIMEKDDIEELDNFLKEKFSDENKQIIQKYGDIAK